MAGGMAAARLPFFFFVFFFFYLILGVYSDPPEYDQYHTFIVHISRSHKPALFRSHNRWYSSLLGSLSSPSDPSNILYTYQKAVNGFSVRLTHHQASDLRLLPGVLSVLPDQPRQIHTTRTPHFLGLTDDFGIWPGSDYADDVIIGVLDTGIWPERPSFSDQGLSPVPPGWKGICANTSNFPSSTCNRKIIGARAYFFGYESALGKSMDETTEPKSPRDTEGHGTHTASTAAGSIVSNAGFFDYARGEARGMASKARIAVYKICWSLGCFDSDILAAMDQAIQDGVHVISLSVGANGYAPQYDHDSIAIGAFGAATHGVVVSCSAGNSGPGPSTAVNIAPWILTVGASTLDREFPADVILGDGRILGGVSLYSGEQLGDEKLPLVYGGDCGDRYCYSGRLDSSKVAGKMVVCDRGGNARVAKGAAVKSAGGVGMILANTEDSGEELLSDSHLIPATMVGQIAGDKIRNYTKYDAQPTATIVFKGTVIGKSPAAPKVASFSSRGPNHLSGEILKPDVIAPGVNILAGWTGNVGPTDLDIDPRRVEFNIISGTSMSCPHVSGLAALLRKAYPQWSPAAIKSALMTTAYNLDNSGKKMTDLATGEASTPFVHGAGHVDPNGALDPGLVYDISASEYIWFLCSIGYDAKRIAVFTRGNVSTVDGDDYCGGREGRLDRAGDLNYPSFSVVFDTDHDQDEEIKYKRVVKNVAAAAADAVYEVSVNSPPWVEVNVSPTKLVFTEDNRDAVYEITFKSKRGRNVLASSSSYKSFGSVEWSDGSGHRVRSPIAVVWNTHESSSSSSSVAYM
ncbi:subtilisin-like protease SBT1.4 [Impatiens glandulifera]|uniref:subtilisin-like protease SBT1.4 n=1 Tax=Impatiens glandulifera TaxID=253017 RepID=UPI001FB17E6A|nr:subtilisin-like protease SBT1.4 [Impatiens glandulifera]